MFWRRELAKPSGTSYLTECSVGEFRLKFYPLSLKMRSKLLLFMGNSKPGLLVLIKSLDSWFSEGTSSIIDSFFSTSSRFNRC